jgi:hypothetical protein
MPSTPQALSFAENGFPSPTTEEIWRRTKRRKTLKNLTGETQFIHMNGYKSDSQVGTKFTNQFVESFADSKTQDSVTRGSAAQPSQSVPMADSVSKENHDQVDTPAAKARSNRKPVERSTETSRRVLKLKSGSGTSQPTIQTFIFKTTHDPRHSLAARVQPTTPFSANEDGVDKSYSNGASSDKVSKSTRSSRKSTDKRTIKFKNYFQTPTPTPNIRTARKPSRWEELKEQVGIIPAQESLPAEDPASIADLKWSFPADSLAQTEEVGTQVSETPKQFHADDPIMQSIYDTTTPVAHASEKNTPANDEANSAQRRSTRIRKPVRNDFLGELSKKEETASAKRSLPAKTKAATKTRRQSLDVEMADVDTQNDHGTDTNHLQRGLPVTPVPDTQIPGVYDEHSRREESFEGFGTPSPESLSTGARASGRVRKPTIKAIEALQSKPKSRKRPRDSDAYAEVNNHPKPTSEVPPSQHGDLTTAPTSRASSAGRSDSNSLPPADLDFLARQLYELASAAFSEPAPADEETKLAELREQFNARQKAAAPAATEVVSDAMQNQQLGQVDPSAPLHHPNEARPWTDAEGWTHTGRVNAHGEEYVLVPAKEYAWVPQIQNFGNRLGVVPLPPPRIKSVKQLERDQVFGFPPLLGQRNLPQSGVRKPYFMPEDVDQLLARSKARREAQSENSKAKGSTQVNEIERPRRKDAVSKKGRPRLKLVLVDSTKMDHPNSTSEGLRKRRQSAPAATEASNGKSSTSTSRKRSLGGLIDDVKDSSPDDPDEIQPRKKRRATLKLITKAQETPPARQKRQSTGKAQATPGRKPVANKATPQGRPSAVKNAQSEKASRGRPGGFTPVNTASKTEAAASPSRLGRPRRRNTGTPRVKSGMAADQ